MEPPAPMEGVDSAGSPPLHALSPTILGWSWAFQLTLCLIPVLAFVFAAHHLRHQPSHRVLFLTALLSSGVTSLAMIWLLLLPWRMPAAVAETDIGWFAMTFLYVWTVLDFWRGGRVTGFRPRGLTAALALAVLLLPVSFLQMSARL